MSFTWTIVYGFVGLLTFIGAPLLIAPVLNMDQRQRLAHIYFKLCMVALDRGLIVERKHGGVDLVSSKFDPDKQGEKVSLGGKTGHFEDLHGFMSRFKHRTFGLVHERSNVVLDPRLADIGEHEKERVESGKVEFETEDGRTGFNSHLELPKSESFVSMKNAIWILPGSGDPGLGDLAEEYVRKSQLGFNRKNVIEIMAGIMAFGICFGLVALTLHYTGGSGGGGSLPSVNLPVGMLTGGWL